MQLGGAERAFPGKAAQNCIMDHWIGDEAISLFIIWHFEPRLGSLASTLDILYYRPLKPELDAVALRLRASFSESFSS